MKLVQTETLQKWEEAYASGSDKRYPSLELVRLEQWFFEHPGNGHIMEYACGTGVNTLHLLECGYEVTAVDAAQGAIDLVGKKLINKPLISNRAHLVRIDPDSQVLPFADSSFDYIVALSILSLLGSEVTVKHLLSEFYRVLKPKGKIILDINDHDSDFSSNQEQIEKNVFLFRGPSGKDLPIRCFCLPDESSFRSLVQPFFRVEDSGYSSHKLFGRRINEWIISAKK